MGCVMLTCINLRNYRNRDCHKLNKLSCSLFCKLGSISSFKTTMGWLYVVTVNYLS